MNKHWRVAILGILLLAALPLVSWADADWQVLQTIELKDRPLDMVVSDTNNQVYVLTDRGQILIYGSNGDLRATIDVGKGADRMQAGPREDILFLLNRKKSTIQMISISVSENIPIEGAPFKGLPDAPVTIVVFSDFQCPYCSRLVPVLQEVFEKNPRGVKIVFKQFPLRSHKFATKAALASIAAQVQGKFWECHDLLFENFNRLDDAKIEEIRAQLKLDPEKFQKIMDDPETMDVIDGDIRDGQQAGVRGTPTIFVDGKRLQDRSMRGFQQAIEKALRDAKRSARL
jgi:protein-disulfide isomerase